MTSWGNSTRTPALSSDLCITIQHQKPYMSYNNNKYVHYIEQARFKGQDQFSTKFRDRNVYEYN